MVITRDRWLPRQTKKIVGIASSAAVALAVLYFLGFLICFSWSGSREDFAQGDRISFSFARDGEGYFFRKLEGRHRSWFEDDVDWHRGDEIMQAIYRPLINRLWTYESAPTSDEENDSAAFIIGHFAHPGAYGMVSMVGGDTCHLITIDGLFSGWQRQHCTRRAMDNSEASSRR